MSFLLRKTSRAKWIAPAGSREKAAMDFKLKPDDTDGLSLYEVASDEERDLVLAAFACRNRSTDPIDFVEVDHAFVAGYGQIDATPETADTPVPEANLLHRSLNWTAEILERLAWDLFDLNTEPIRYNRERIVLAVRKLDPQVVTGDDEQAFAVRIKGGERK